MYNKIVAINGKYYTPDKKLSVKRTDALVVRNKEDVNFIIEDVLQWVVMGGFEIKRIEVLNFREEVSK